MDCAKQGLCESLVAQGRQEEAVDFLQTQQQTLEADPGTSKVSTVEVQLLLGKVCFPPNSGVRKSSTLGAGHSPDEGAGYAYARLRRHTSTPEDMRAFEKGALADGVHPSCEASVPAGTLPSQGNTVRKNTCACRCTRSGTGMMARLWLSLMA